MNWWHNKPAEVVVTGKVTQRGEAIHVVELRNIHSHTAIEFHLTEAQAKVLISTLQEGLDISAEWRRRN